MDMDIHSCIMKWVLSVIPGPGVVPYYKKFCFYHGTYFLLKEIIREKIDQWNVNQNLLIHEIEELNPLAMN